jgi:2-polyprenyl-3-methyl-5-hydroxy-6-metoxy-1,4-benzoquinol methylase
MCSIKNKFVAALLFVIPSVFALAEMPQNQKQTIDPKRLELLSGVKKNGDPKLQWDQKYSKEEYVFGKTPVKFLAENIDYLPSGGKVLDMGMGEGRNAVFLARHGLKVTGVDISSVAIRKAKALADEFGVKIDAVTASMTEYPIKPESFDAIVCVYYLERSLHKKMIQWLKPGGILIYEAHTINQLKYDRHYNPNFMLKSGELLNLFPELTVLKYEEPLHQKEYSASAIFKKTK